MLTADRLKAESSINPMELKKRLAWDITRQFHDAGAADAAQQHFERVVQGRDIPEDIPQFAWPAGGAERRWSNLLVEAKLAASVSDAKRLLRQGAVEVMRSGGGFRPVTEDRLTGLFNPGDVIKVGKRRFVRLVGPP